jgi:hypothetical protein
MNFAAPVPGAAFLLAVGRYSAVNVEERLDRIESSLAIQQLPMRYALAVDARDLEAWLALFPEDVDCGRFGTGREALRRTIDEPLATFYRSIHQICGHQYSFVDADHASGHVYCRAEHEVGDRWIVMAICYFDDYVRRDGGWYFARRRERHWYAADVLRRPQEDLDGWPGRDLPPALPAAFPSWSAFWNRWGEARTSDVTDRPAAGEGAN